MIPPPRRILLVCSGNTCRSAMAEGVLRKLAREAGLPGVEIASAGTRATAGRPADPRAVTAARTRGVDLSGHASRCLEARDLVGFDLVLAMERRHLDQIHALAGPAGGRCRLLMSFAPGESEEVPDPFEGTAEDYLETIAELEKACRGLIAAINPSGGPRPRRGDGRR